MKIEKRETRRQRGIRFSITDNKQEIASAYLYILHNNYHIRPLSLIEYVIVNDKYQGQGVGTKLIKAMIKEARKQNCYKVLLWSRYSKPKVHVFYKKLGFKDWGKEFRMDL